MGILFTLIFVATTYLSPQVVFGSLSLLHIELLIAGVAFLFAMLGSEGSGLLRMPQTYGLIAFCALVPISVFATGWLGGGFAALLQFAPSGVVFILIVANFKKKIHLQMLAAAIFCVIVFIMLNAWDAFRKNDITSLYWFFQSVGDGNYIYRLRGLSFLSDPNDLAQTVVGLIPLMFLSWSKGKFPRNFILVIVPVSVLLYCMYLTHSRGGMVALMAVSMVAFRRKLGTVKAVVLGGVLFVGLSAVGWSGGRDVSAGSDREDAWSHGLVLIRTHPVFGVGYRMFTDHYPITAHNTVVVCAAELGMLGFISWMMLVVPTLRDTVLSTKAPSTSSEPEPEPGQVGGRFRRQLKRAVVSTHATPKLAYANAGFTGATAIAAPAETVVPAELTGKRGPSNPYLLNLPNLGDDKLPEAEARRLSTLALLSLTGFLTAGWFLSRAYSMTFFVTIGIAQAIYRIARDTGTAPPPWPIGKALKTSATASVIVIALLYVFLRINGLLGR